MEIIEIMPAHQAAFQVDLKLVYRVVVRGHF